jgi:hypothetical protein
MGRDAVLTRQPPGFQRSLPCIRRMQTRCLPDIWAAQREEVGAGRRQGDLPGIPGDSPTDSPRSFVTVSIQSAAAYDRVWEQGNEGVWQSGRDGSYFLVNAELFTDGLQFVQSVWRARRVFLFPEGRSPG